MPRLSQILVPVIDLDAALDFYTTTVGLALKFRDGDRYAALDGGEITLALVAGAERVAGDAVSFALQVDDAESFVTGAARAGAVVAAAVVAGPHENRGCVLDRDGHPIVVSSKPA